MRNLFVCHSQAQLLLAVSLAKGRFKSEINDLILFVDFAMKEDLRCNVIDSFNQCLFRIGTYPAINKTWKAKSKRYPDDIKEIRIFMKEPYTRIFEVCDGCIPEMYILKQGFKRNLNVEAIWLEDGSYPYFRNVVQRDGFDSNTFSRFMHRMLFKYVFGLGEYYDRDFDEMAGSKKIKKAYLTFPGFERDPYHSQREIIGISEEEYANGIRALYNNIQTEQVGSNVMLLVLDKLDVYENIEKTRKMLDAIIKDAVAKGWSVWCKFHPREEGKWDIFSKCQELDKDIAIEGYYASYISCKEKITIVGIKSTGLQVAKKLGYRVVSLAQLCGEENENLDSFYKRIGIAMPSTVK